MNMDANAQIRALIATSELDCQRARAHLFGLLPPHDMGAWDVDLAVPVFTAGPAAELHVRSHVQLVATWSSRDGTWLWADHNPSISPRGYETLMTALAAIEPLKALRTQPRFTVDRDLAIDLATWCARKAGFAGAWPGPAGDAIAMLAIDPIVWPGSRLETTGRQWCSFCGKARTEVKTLIAGPAVNICDECTDMLGDIADAEAPRGSSDLAGMPPCAFCGERTPRIFAPYAAMCRGCIGLARGTLKR